MESWFNIITPQAIRRRTFGTVKELITKIENFVAYYNAESKPFRWTATADLIFHELPRLCKIISET
ncbi:MAG: hypothetical protein ACLFUU_11270 [Desulfobacteraceae bacterium]